MTGHDLQSPAVKPGVPERRRSPRRIDWDRAAHLVVAGLAPDAIAAAIGIGEAQFWDHLDRSTHFRGLIRRARERQSLLGSLLGPGEPPAGRQRP